MMLVLSLFPGADLLGLAFDRAKTWGLVDEKLRSARKGRKK